MTGVRTAGPNRLLHADLVVDSSGRQSALPDWLTQLPGSAVAQIPETIIDSGRRITSRAGFTLIRPVHLTGTASPHLP